MSLVNAVEEGSRPIPVLVLVVEWHCFPCWIEAPPQGHKSIGLGTKHMVFQRNTSLPEIQGNQNQAELAVWHSYRSMNPKILLTRLQHA
jgi:hypothetical protein